MSRYRRAAEWETHQATWLSWPHNRHDWPGKFTPIDWVFGEMVRHICPGEVVKIIVKSEAHSTKAKRVLAKAGIDPARVEWVLMDTDRGWTRDLGPIFVENGDPDKKNGVAIVDFQFNAWAKYDNWDLDNRISFQVAAAYGYPLITPAHHPFVLEGGAIDVNGQGTLLSTEECLLDTKIQVRNPHLTQTQIEETLSSSFDVSDIIWLGKGIVGDDTHGHVDDLCRFVNSDTVVLCQEGNPNDDNYALLAENKERLQNRKLANGHPLQVVGLPMPNPLYFAGIRLPASYANFYISNHSVIVPTFNDPKDRIALGILANLFPDRVVVGIHAVDLVWGFGTLHCLTNEEPLGRKTLS